MQQPPPPDPQQPYTEYPPHYPSPPIPQRPPLPPVRKPTTRVWQWVLLGIVLLLIAWLTSALIGVQVYHSNKTVSTQTTSTYQPVWTTTQTFTAAGNKETSTFTVASSEWKLVWSCNPSSSAFGEYNVIVRIYDADDTSVNKLVINEICKVGNAQGETEIRRSGNFYFDIIATGEYTLKVQELE